MSDVRSEMAGLSVDAAVLAEVPLERLETEITGFASRLAAATATWLVWVGAYDERRGWEQWGAKSCAHWLNWQCGMSPRSAREHVFVARRLTEFDRVRNVFLAGEISYSKVRAICRVVEPANEAELLDIAQAATASQLDRIVGKMPPPGGDSGGGSDNGDMPVTPAGMSVRHNHDGTATITITAPVDDIAVAKEAVESAVSRAVSAASPEGTTRTEAIEQLGGLAALRARTALGLMVGRTDLVEEPAADVLVVVDVDALSGADESAECTVDHHRAPAELVRRLCCDAMIETAMLNDTGDPVGIGRKSRIVPRRLRRLLLRRDHGMCQFPGCEATRRLHAHHVVHWAHGGPTDLDNLLSLCHHHHGTVHEGGWNVTAEGRRRWVFSDPHGNPHHVPVLRLPTRALLPKPCRTGHHKNGAAAPLYGLGEPCNTDYVADILIANTALRRSGI